jgi:CRISPR-associated protein Csb1
MSTNQLTLKQIQTAAAGTAAAFRCTLELQPAGGSGTKVFPPTYEGGKYATEGPRYEETEEGRKATSYDRVLLDSVQSQANRMELALLAAWENKEISLPVITVDFSHCDLPKAIRVSSLEAPHRIADALLRDSLHPGEKKKFRECSVGKALDHVDTRNATPLFQFCPTALLFGLWDSTGPKGGGGAKFQRAIVSEIMAEEVKVGIKTSSRIDPAQIQVAAGPLFRAPKGGWTLNADEAVKEKGKPVNVGQDGKPSEANHGNILPSLATGGVVMNRAVQTTVLSLTAIRRLRFPLNGKHDLKVDAAAWTALAALGLCAAILAREQNTDLRSRCQLFPSTPYAWELLDKPGTPPQRFTIDRDGALALFKAALASAIAVGLPWQKEEVVLQPSPQLVELIRRSQQLAAQQVAVEGGN